MFFYVDYKQARNDDLEYWIQFAMRMTMQDALEKLNALIAKGWDVRLQVCNEDRISTIEMA
jgi:hypothetical protein